MDNNNKDAPRQLEYAMLDFSLAEIKEWADWHLAHGNRMKGKVRLPSGAEFRFDLAPLQQQRLPEGRPKRGHTTRPDLRDYDVFLAKFRQAEAGIMADFQKDLEHWQQEWHYGKTQPSPPPITKNKLAAAEIIVAVTLTRLMIYHHLVDENGLVWDTAEHPPSSWPNKPPCPKRPCRNHP